MAQWVYETDFAKIGIKEENDFITEVFFAKDEKCVSESELTRKAFSQICEYFEGKRKIFDLPLAPKGTNFQQKVWQALQQIPFGKTVSYQEIAIQIGNHKACRAVGMANNKNPIGIIIPCHRVVGKNGSLTGYAGGLEIKQKLLDIEHQ